MALVSFRWVTDPKEIDEINKTTIVGPVLVKRDGKKVICLTVPSDERGKHDRHLRRYRDRQRRRE